MAQTLLVTSLMHVTYSKFNFVSVLFITGVATGALLDISMYFALGASIGIFVFARFLRNLQMKSAAVTMGLSFLSGILLQQIQPKQSIEYLPQPCSRVVEGTVDAPPFHTGTHTKLELRLSAVSECLNSATPNKLQPYHATAYITVHGTQMWPVNRGHRVRFAAHLQPKRRHARFLSSSDNSQPFYTAYINDHRALAVVNQSDTPIETWLQKRRDAIQQILRKNMPGNPAGLAIALTTGVRQMLTNEQLEKFRDTGTSHLLVVSGLHLGIIALLTYQLSLLILRRIPTITSRTNIHRVCSGVTIPAILFFALFTGANPPVVRAAIMVSAVLTARLLSRQTTALPSLLAAATFLLALNPTLIVNAGFQLSVASVTGFILFQRRPEFANALALSNSQNERPESASIRLIKRFFTGMRNYFQKLLWISFIAFGVTAPFLSWHFHAVPLISPIANLALVPLVSTALLPLLTVAIILLLASMPLAVNVVNGATALITITEKIAESFARYAPVVTTTDLPAQLTSIVASAGLLSLMTRRFRLCAFFFSLCLISVVTSKVVSMHQHDANALILDFLDVGQGDATLITFPNEEHWLVDAGGTARPSIGRDHIVPVLKGLRINRLEKLILTHPDPDHVAGVPDVLRAVSVGEIWDNQQGMEEPSPPAYSEMRRLAKQNQIPVYSGKSLCKTTKTNTTAVKVIHPCDDRHTYYPWFSFNDNSLVLAIFHGDQSILLPGDLSKEGENHLLSQRSLQSFDLLKLGHHGSASSTSEAFLRKIRPRYAVASCGFHNRYKFPSRSIQSRLSKHGIRLFSTSGHGWIRFVISSNKIKIITQKASI